MLAFLRQRLRDPVMWTNAVQLLKTVIAAVIAWVLAVRVFHIEQAWSVVRQARESGRLNPRRAAAGRMRAAEGFDAILDRVEQAVAEIRSMARTIRLGAVAPADWDPAFRTRWLELLDAAGDAIARADVEAIEAVRADLDAFAGDLAVDELSEYFWPACGALLVNLRNILAALDVVAEAQPVEVPAPV